MQRDFLLVSQVRNGYSVSVGVAGHFRTYSADSFEAAKTRAERLCYILELKPDIIEYFQPGKSPKAKRKIKVEGI